MHLLNIVLAYLHVMICLEDNMNYVVNVSQYYPPSKIPLLALPLREHTTH